MAEYSVDTWAFYSRKIYGCFQNFRGSIFFYSSTLKYGLYLEKLYFSKFLKTIKEKEIVYQECLGITRLRNTAV